MNVADQIRTEMETVVATIHSTQIEDDLHGKAVKRLKELLEAEILLNRVNEGILQEKILRKQLEPDERTWIERLLTNEPLLREVFKIGAIVMVLNYEKTDTIVSRAFSWIKFR